MKQLSPIDEGVHLDYVDRASNFEIPRTGDFMGQNSLQITACMGISLPGIVLPACGPGPYVPAEFPGGGFQYEAQQPPLYYFVTAPMRPFVQFFAGTRDYTMSLRLTGAIWLAVGLIVLWFAGRKFEVDEWTLVGAIFVAGCAPNVVYYSSIVSNDAASILAGSIAALAIAPCIKSSPSRQRTFALFAVGFAVAMLKPMNVLPLGALALFLFALHASRNPKWRDERRRFFLQWLRGGGSLVAGGGVAVATWYLIYTRIGYVDPKTMPVFAGLAISGFPIATVFSQGSALLGLATDSAASPGLAQPSGALFRVLTRAIFITAGLAGLFSVRRTWEHLLGLATILVLIVGGVGISLVFWLSLKMDPGAPSRYGLPLVPLLVIVMAAHEGNRLRQLSIWGIGTGLFVTTLIGVI